MNYALLEKSSPLAATTHRLERSLLAKMKALQERLDNFTVLDRYGIPVGDVRNLVLHQQQLSLVIVQPDVHRHWRFVLLSCHLVERISLRDRVVHVRTTQADMSYLPEHGATHQSVNYTTNAKEQPKPLVPMNTAQKVVFQPPSTGKESPLLDAPATPKVLASAMSTTDPRSPHLTHQANHSSASGAIPFSDRGNSAPLQNGQPPKTQPGMPPHGTIALLESAPIKVEANAPSAQPSIVNGEFTSPKQASQFLEAIAKTLSHRCKTIRIEIELDDPALQEVCQEWLNQYMAMSKN